MDGASRSCPFVGRSACVVARSVASAFEAQSRKLTVSFPPQLGRSSSPETVILPVPPSIQSYLKPVPPLIGSRLHCRDLARTVSRLSRSTSRPHPERVEGRGRGTQGSTLSTSWFEATLRFAPHHEVSGATVWGAFGSNQKTRSTAPGFRSAWRRNYSYLMYFSRAAK